MSLPRHLIRWSEARALLLERSYSADDLLLVYKQSRFPVYMPHLHTDPTPYRKFLFGNEHQSDEWVEHWLYHDAQIDRDFVEETWPELSTGEGAADPKKRRGGRPSTHDWAGLSAYMTAYLVEKDYPATQAALELEAQNWFENQLGKVPDESAIRRWVKDLYGSRDRLIAER